MDREVAARKKKKGEDENSEVDDRIIEDDPIVWDALNKWTSNSQADILIDGVKINAVISRMKAQLEFLRGKVALLIVANNERETNDKIDKLIQDVLNLEKLCEDRRLDQIRMDSELKRQQIVLTAQENKYTEFLSYAESKFAYYRTNINALEEQIVKLKEKEQEQQKRIINAELQAAHNFQDLKNMFDGYKIENAQLVQGLKDEIDNLRSAVETAEGTVHKMEGQVIHVTDIVSINDLRVTDLSKRFITSNAYMNEIRDELDELPAKHIEPLAKTIAEVVQTKADRTELTGKADVAITMSKADVQDISRLDELISEMERMVLDHKRAVSEELVSYDAKIERKGDRITQNCVKELRRLLAKINQPKETATDIGKVKCLVCDQVTQQYTEAQGTVFGGPPMRTKDFHVLESRDDSPPSRHRERSPSPVTNANQNGKVDPLIIDVGDSTSRLGLGRPTETSIHATLPKVTGSGSGHSKLVKMGATPLLTVAASVSGEFASKTSAVNEANQQTRQSAPHPIEQILPAHLLNSDRENMQKENPLLANSKLRYFKDLEE